MKDGEQNKDKHNFNKKIPLAQKFCLKVLIYHLCPRTRDVRPAVGW